MSKNNYLIVVDDEEDLKFLFEYFFQKEIAEGLLGFYFYSTAKEAIKSIEGLDGNIVVLSDINMPDMNGIEFLKYLTQNFSDLKVYLVSAYAEDQYRNELELWGAAGYITKPVNFEHLKEKVLRILGIASH